MEIYEYHIEDLLGLCGAKEETPLKNFIGVCALMSAMPLILLATLQKTANQMNVFFV